MDKDASPTESKPTKTHLSRRTFVMGTLAGGFALAVMPVSAQTITTDSNGLIAGAVTKAGSYGAHHDPFRADRVWLYATVLTVGYMISRGIAKAGSRQPYDEKA